ncbi:MAG: hypothetical protein II054_04980 [Treponema sp.]|nr:hypothetical protein [Treponema sp.]
MNPYMLNLIICLGGTVLWISTLTTLLILISRTKKRMAQKNIAAEKITPSYTVSIVLCGIVCALPYMILFKPYVTAIFEGCAVMGTLAIMRERLEKLKKSATESKEQAEGAEEKEV